MPSQAGETATCDQFEKQRIFDDSELSYELLLHAVDAGLFLSIYRCYLFDSQESCHLLGIEGYPTL